MKNILRNNLWMIAVGWCLVLNNYSILAIVVTVLASFYLSFTIANKNYWRMLSVFLIFFVTCLFFSYATSLHHFKYFWLFTLTLSINIALFNERLISERLRIVYRVFICIFISFAFFLLIALLLPYKYVLLNSKESLFALISLIFIPFTSTMLIALISKEYSKKRLLDKINTKKGKMYN